MLKRIHLVQIGVGLIGGTTLTLLRENRARWRERFGIEVAISAIAGSDGALLSDDPAGFHDEMLRQMIAERRRHVGLAQFADANGLRLVPVDDAIDDVASLGPFIVADSATGSATASSGARALRLGGSAIYTNKAPLSLPLDDPSGSAIWSAAAAGRVRYETSCGAGLPVISTVQSLLDTGDEVIEIAGALSGTFGAIFSDVAAGLAFSNAVRSAKDLGYTEPDPRDDLSGLDVARKALILARTLGRRANLDDIAVENLVPESLRDVSVESYLERVVEQDAAMADRASAAAADGKTLKYIAQVGADGEIAVGLQPVARSTVLGALQGPENIITIRTRRYDDYPMNVTGPGAGAAVTSAGVLADMLVLATGSIGSRS